MAFGDQGIAQLSCDSSQLTVVLESTNIDGWISAMVDAETIASIVVGALGFSLGSGYSVDLVQITEQNGSPHVLGVRPSDPEAPDKNLGFDPHGEIFNRVLRLAARDIYFRMAIRDYLQAMNDVADCAMYCYRAIESLKNAFVLKSGQDRWDEMHTALGTDRESLTETIKQYADPVRHGNWTNTIPTDKYIRYRILDKTRAILLRYVDIEQPVS